MCKCRAAKRRKDPELKEDTLSLSLLSYAANESCTIYQDDEIIKRLHDPTVCLLTWTASSRTWRFQTFYYALSLRQASGIEQILYHYHWSSDETQCVSMKPLSLLTCYSCKRSYPYWSTTRRNLSRDDAIRSRNFNYPPPLSLSNLNYHLHHSSSARHGISSNVYYLLDVYRLAIRIAQELSLQPALISLGPRSGSSPRCLYHYIPSPSGHSSTRSLHSYHFGGSRFTGFDCAVPRT